MAFLIFMTPFQICLEGEVVVLEAVIISTPPPHEIHWYHNDNGPLKSNHQFKIIQEGDDVFKLVLGDNRTDGVDQANHSGHYRINAANIAGSVQSACQIVVNSKPVQVIHFCMCIIRGGGAWSAGCAMFVL